MKWNEIVTRCLALPNVGDPKKAREPIIGLPYLALSKLILAVRKARRSKSYLLLSLWKR